MRSQTLFAAVVVIAVALYLIVGRNAPVVSIATAFDDAVAVVDAVEQIQPDTLLVHVSGAVVNPGIVELEPGSRVVDAIGAAGGASRQANLSAINLVSLIADGDQLVVPAVGESPGAPAGSVETDDGALVDLNMATMTQLLDLPGIGPVLAERIMRHREQHGPFSAVEDLLDVSGIGEARLLELRSLVDV